MLRRQKHALRRVRPPSRAPSVGHSDSFIINIANISVRIVREKAPKSRNLVNLLLLWEAADLAKCPGLLDPASKKPLALVRCGAELVQKRFWMVQDVLGRPLLPGSKRPTFLLGVK